MGNSVPDTKTLQTGFAWLDAGFKVAVGMVTQSNGSAPRQPGSLIVIRGDGAFAGSVSAGCVESAIVSAALEIIAGSAPRDLHFGAGDIVTPGLACDGSIEVHLRAANRETLDALAVSQPHQSELVIIGAVHIAQALAPLAALAGYTVRIIDPRSAYATEERFPGVRLDICWPDEALSIEPLTEKSALVVLAHDPKIDDVALSVGLRSPAFYLGVLGSRISHAKRLTRLEAQGFSRRELMRLHGPVGLAIGAQSPEEIAVAIVAEIVKTTRRPKPRIGGIIMAAGSSKRMGSNKLTMIVNGRPLVRHVVESALASRLDPVIVVTGNESAAIEDVLRSSDVTFVHNPDFEAGLSTSLRTGLDALPQHCEAAMILLGDMPGITSSLIESVASLYDPGAGRLICAASAMGRIGHPILWARGFFDELTAVSGDIGARDVLQKHVEKIFTAPANPNALQDIDTVAELERAQAPHAVGS